MRLDGGQRRGLHANERGQDGAALPAGPGAGTGDATGARLERGAEGPGVGRGGVGAPWLCLKEGAQAGGCESGTPAPGAWPKCVELEDDGGWERAVRWILAGKWC